MMAKCLSGSVRRPDTEAQDQLPQINHFRLATRGRSIQTGQTRTSEGRLTLPITKVRQGGGKQGRFTVVFTKIPA